MQHRHFELREFREPHWGWFVTAILIPGALLLLTLLGLGRGSFIAARVAVALPTLAIVVALGALTTALTRRELAAVRIAAAGVVLTLLGCAWLYWVSSSHPR